MSASDCVVVVSSEILLLSLKNIAVAPLTDLSEISEPPLLVCTLGRVKAGIQPETPAMSGGLNFWKRVIQCTTIVSVFDATRLRGFTWTPRT